MGRWRSGQDETSLAELHPRHGRRHLRPGQLRETGRGQAGAPKPDEADRQIQPPNHRDCQQAGSP